MYSYKLIMLATGLCLVTHANKAKTQTVVTNQTLTSNAKQAAYQILEAKCNSCHLKKNPRRVFTSANMAELAPKIYRQVFVKKRMPKRGGEPLTQEEYARLKTWLNTQSIN